jgi:hypothetical protein
LFTLTAGLADVGTAQAVMAGLDPAIHHSSIESGEKRWTPGSSPGVTDGASTPKQKNPALRRDFPALGWFRLELAIFLRIGVLALTARILLLLAGLLAAALLLAGLLAGLLTRVLVLLARVLILLARVLVWVRHRTSPLHVERSERQPTNPALVSEKNAGSAVIIAWRRFVATVAREPKPNLVSPKPLYKTLQPHVALLPPRVPTVRKWNDASFRLPGAIAAELRRAFS